MPGLSLQPDAACLTDSRPSSSATAPPEATAVHSRAPAPAGVTALTDLGMSEKSVFYSKLFSLLKDLQKNDKKKTLLFFRSFR
jgi:hypothetical protein